MSRTPCLDRFLVRRQASPDEHSHHTVTHKGRLTSTRNEHLTAYPHSYCHSLMRASLGGSVRWQQQPLAFMKQPADIFEQVNSV